ncbi:MULTISPECIES: GrxA family glutaredoxin [Marinobacter]|jgi:glutaredoxin 1|uniref:GrxA family glutaredoxin n=2 Tax=Marinobacteraceae TaxID=2887365 RepID=UPI001B191626|nr:MULTISPECIES: GrxA family glutaredoxin [Marinobacter]MBO6850748.1 GrxA family glutaredoxin [Marinobacter sp.]MCK7552299.1 GrxA family glutaredoxin [Marinobacter goseongensis]MDV3505129.1 GrxA family glutaredoxin [Marinobacter sp. M-5]
MEHVTIYGRTSCGFCVRAKQLCESRGIPFTWVDMVAERLSKEDIADRIGRPVHTVPQILVGQRYIGGSDEFIRYLREQETANANG